MTLRLHAAHSARLRTITAGCVLGLAAGSAAVVGGVSPASASPLDFDCTVPIVGAKTFTVDVTGNAPAELATGSSAAPTITSTMTIPADLADLMRSFLSIDEAAGTVLSQVSVDGVPTPTTLTIPRTDIGDSGPAVLTATGTMAPITAGAPGDVIDLAAGAQQVDMVLYDTSGSAEGSPFAIPCSPSSGQDLTVDQISVVQAGSTTKATTSYSASRDKATGVAVVKSSNGIPATGDVKFTLKRGTTKVATATKALTNGKATAAFARVSKAGKYTLVAKYVGSETVTTSTGKDTFSVR